MADSLTVIVKNNARADKLNIKLRMLGLTSEVMYGNAKRFIIWNCGLQGQYSMYNAEGKYPKNPIKINRILECQTKEELFDLITGLGKD